LIKLKNVTEKLKMELPAEGTVYDYKLDIKTKLWVTFLHNESKKVIGLRQ